MLEPIPQELCWNPQLVTEDQKWQHIKKFIVVNEIMVSEDDASSVSVYRLRVNDKDLGKFRSSGILVATGTGSTGWLHSSKQISANDIHLFREFIESKK